MEVPTCHLGSQGRRRGHDGDGEGEESGLHLQKKLLSSPHLRDSARVVFQIRGAEQLVWFSAEVVVVSVVVAG